MNACIGWSGDWLKEEGGGQCLAKQLVWAGSLEGKGILEPPWMEEWPRTGGKIW